MLWGSFPPYSLQVTAHYFEEGNVQLDAKHECNDSTILQVITNLQVFLYNYYFWSVLLSLGGVKCLIIFAAFYISF